MVSLNFLGLFGVIIVITFTVIFFLYKNYRDDEAADYEEEIRHLKEVNKRLKITRTQSKTFSNSQIEGMRKIAEGESDDGKDDENNDDDNDRGYFSKF